MDEKSQAELEIIDAADRWARDIMRQERFLDQFEQKLLDAVLQYQRITRVVVEAPPVQLPRPPYIPADLFITETPTTRYSDIPTSPTPSNLKLSPELTEEDIIYLESIRPDD